MSQLLSEFLTDFRHGCRILFKRAGLTFLGIFALGISMGMVISTFAALNALFWKPLPYEDSANLRLVNIVNKAPSEGGFLSRDSYSSYLAVPYGELSSLEASPAFENITAYYLGTVNLSGMGEPRRLDGLFVTRNLLETLGVEPFLGRTFSESVDLLNSEPEILISHRLWDDTFRADPNIIGSTVRANGNEHTIVGVLPPGFNFPTISDVFIPLRPTMQNNPVAREMFVNATARIRSDWTREELQAELDVIFKAWPSIPGMDMDQLELKTLKFGTILFNDASRNFMVFSALGTAIILLVACANVANLLVGHALSRGREIAIRTALGAPRLRICRQLFTESFVLCLFGALIGLLYASWVSDYALDSEIWPTPSWVEFSFDIRVWLFAGLVVFVTSLLAGAIPAWQASKVNLNEALKESSMTSTGFRLGKFTRILAIAQLSFSIALIFAAGLLVRHILQFSNAPTGYEASEILTMRMGLFQQDYPTEEERDAFYNQLCRRVESLSGIRDAAVSSWLGQFGNSRTPFLLPGQAIQAGENPPLTYFESVSPNYFATMDIPVLNGRGFLPEDSLHSSSVIIVNTAFVTAFLDSAPENVVGSEIRIFTSKENSDPVRIVGVVGNAKMSTFLESTAFEPIVYLPSQQTDSAFMTLMVRIEKRDPEELATAIRGEIFQLDPHLPAYFVRTIGEFVEEQLLPFRMLANYVATIGLMSLFLACIGVYGMIAFSVRRRGRELGIRMALGASTKSILRLVLQQGFSQLLFGIFLGSGLAFGIGFLIRSFINGVNPVDPGIFAAASLILIAVTGFALFVPARRATRISPMQAIRYE